MITEAGPGWGTVGAILIIVFALTFQLLLGYIREHFSGWRIAIHRAIVRYRADSSLEVGNTVGVRLTRGYVLAEVQKVNSATVWVRLPDGHSIKRKIHRDIILGKEKG